MVEFMTTSGVAFVRLDTNGDVGIFDASGNEIVAIPAQGTTATTTFPRISKDSSGNLYLIAKTGSVTQIKGSTSYSNFNASGQFSVYGGIASAGIGVPGIYALSVQNPVNAAPTAVSYTPPATAGYYRVSYYLDITTATTITFIAKLTYTDPAGTARSANLMFVNEGGTAVLAGGPAANTAGQWQGSQTFAIDNSATAITVVNNAGTYTTCNYRWQVALEQLG